MKKYYVFTGFVRGTCYGTVQADTREEALAKLKAGDYHDLIDTEIEFDGFDESSVRDE